MKENLPPWLKKRLLNSEAILEMKAILSEASVGTVCESALCPNLNECFSEKKATFLILGPACTRHCGFCSVRKGRPSVSDPDEPARIADVVKKLGLEYVVVTSVTRDDLPDGGANQFVRTIELIRRSAGSVKIEVLVPDFSGLKRPVEGIVKAMPDIFGHNIETVRRLYPMVRHGSGYARSLSLLRMAKDIATRQITKSGLMVGLGEGPTEIFGTMSDIREAGCDILTIGQYLRPSPENIPIARFVKPAEFDEYKRIGEGMGFGHVSSGPFVRSSYNAEAMYKNMEVRLYDDRCAAAAGRGHQ